MVERQIVWTKTADLQLKGILSYWLERNKSNSYPKRLIQLINEKTKEIQQNPYSYKSAGYMDTRMAVIENFSIYYQITPSSIIVTAFWDNRQDPKKLLEILKKLL